MSLSNTNTRTDAVGNGATDTYPYTFKIFAETDLKVTVRSTAGVETVLTLTTHYTVAGVGSTTGGNVVLVNGAFTWITGGFLTNGYSITIRRVRPLTQTTDIRNQGAFFPETHEDAFDDQVMIAQQQQDEINRSVKLPDTVLPSAFSPTLPATLASNPDKLLKINAAGTGWDIGPSVSQLSDISGSVTAAAGSATAAAVSAASAATDAGAVLYRWGGTVGGTANAITLTPSPALTVYTTGQRFVFVATATNTAAATVNISGLGAVALNRKDDTDTQSGDVVSGLAYTIMYDGNTFRLIDPVSVPTDHGALTGLADDDHSQYPLLGSTETITGVWTFSATPIVPAPSAGGNPTTKTYVDAADATVASNAATAAATKVGLSGNESISGTKTFTSNPIVPAPTTDTHASTKKYVDDAVASAGGGGFTSLQAFTASGTWTKPASVTKVLAKVWGGGGGGGRGGGGSISGPGGGGGAGGYAEKFVDVTGDVAVTVGSGGAAAPDQNNPGGNGGASSFGSAIHATGGTGASSLNGGSGGTGSSGTLNLTGQSGRSALSTDETDGGNGGTSPFGGMGGAGGYRGNNASSVAAGSGVVGSVPGGGGGGSGARGGTGGDGDGAAGAAGMVLVYW